MGRYGQCPFDSASLESVSVAYIDTLWWLQQQQIVPLQKPQELDHRERLLHFLVV